MSGPGYPSIPPPQFSTFTTIIDPPRPLPAYAQSSASLVSTINSLEGKHSAGTVEPSTGFSQQMRVPYPTSVPAAIAASSSGTVAPASIQSHPSVKPKMSLAPQSSKGYQSKRTFKVIIVGDAGVGKTCLSFRFCCGRFPEHTEATIGVDFRERSCVIEKELLRVQLWDTAGQERYRQSIVAHYYRNVNAVVFVYDVSNKASFDGLNSWIAECDKHGLTATSEVPRILIGNKCDLATIGEKVSMDIAQVFADRNNMALFETSAKADSEADHVESIFLTLVHKLQQSKPMHVQSASEQSKNKDPSLLLKAEDRAKMTDDSMCC